MLSTKAILAEVIAFTSESEGRITADQMRALIQRVDGTKSKRRMELLGHA